MFGFAIGFTVGMHKRAASSQEETPPGSKVPGGKRPKRSGLDGEAQNRLAVIIGNSLERALDAMSTLDGVSQEALREPYASLENGVLDWEVPDDRVVGEAPLEITIELSFSARQQMPPLLG